MSTSTVTLINCVLNYTQVIKLSIMRLTFASTVKYLFLNLSNCLFSEF